MVEKTYHLVVFLMPKLVRNLCSPKARQIPTFPVFLRLYQGINHSGRLPKSATIKQEMTGTSGSHKYLIQCRY